MKRLIYRYAFLFELLAVLPAAALCIFLDYRGYADAYIYILLFAWGFFVISWVNRRIPADLHKEALKKLDEDCDPVAFMKDIAFMLSRRGISARRRFLLSMEHAGALDALGRYGEALAEIERLERENVLLDPTASVLFRINCAVISLHVERTQGGVPARIREIENDIVRFGFPPPVAVALRVHLEMLRDAVRFTEGDYAGLRERFVEAVERARAGNSRRQLIAACMRLARLYDKLERTEEALALYGFVVQNGNLLGAVREAAERMAELKSA